MYDHGVRNSSSSSSSSSNNSSSSMQGWQGSFTYWCAVSLLSVWSWLFLRQPDAASTASLHQGLSRTTTTTTANMVSMATDTTSHHHTTLVENSTASPMVPAILADSAIAARSTGSIANPDASNDSSHLAYLPLWPWEQASTSSDRTCQTPQDSMPEYCCLGATDAATYRSNVCNLTRSVYQRNEQLALSFLPRLENQVPHRDVECDVCRLVNVLLEHNWTMAFVGDSVTRQSFMALECELRRRNMFDAVLKGIRFTFTGIDRSQRLNESDHSWEYGLRFIRELRVTKKSTFNGSLSDSVAVIRLYNMYRPNLTDVQEYIGGRHDVVIFDFGLHYEPGSVDFISEITNLLPLFKMRMGHSDHDVELKLLAWRETSAQHFDTLTGHFDSNHVSATCAPLRYKAGVVGNERRQAMEQVVQALNWTDRDLVILPFREYSSQFHELHIGGKDCTHFCSTPSFWIYEWRQIRIAVENAMLQWQPDHLLAA
jgi:hypothetical protein